jgi:hypothetical protein
MGVSHYRTVNEKTPTIFRKMRFCKMSPLYTIYDHDCSVLIIDFIVC